ncbi:MAG TPA: heavy metal translocating P-type ATPase, partial [Gammaproteobacteria bacterium]|nr:heavy metal translocating P-type ATPase [Gammaproteobacteria bacterium]
VVSLEEVRAGDRLLVRHGEIVPVDGTLAIGLAVLDESALTGEAVPVPRQAGDLLRSGSLNAAASFDMLATTTSAESTYAGIVRLVEAARRSKAPAARLADRYALWFIPASLALAGLAWLLSGDVVRALAVLVVATPCPLILAVPVALVSGMSNCARRGILVKGGDALEKLASARTLFFDKTGTLTGGQARLAAIEGNTDISDNELLMLTASLEQKSNHVIASAIVAAAQARHLVLSVPAGVEDSPGAGVKGRVAGRQIAAGTRDYVARFSELPQTTRDLLKRVDSDGVSPVFVAVDGRFAGVLLLADQIRLETPRALRLLRQAGIRRIVMLTGDRREVADAIGSVLGVDEVFAEQDPAQKLAVIAATRGGGIMVGDGVNDAPALAAADVGVAMGARGTAASAEAAGVVLLVDRLDRLAEALHITRHARRIAVQSAAIGMSLSLLAMAVAAAGYLPPIAGAILQEAIDVAAIGNALRALRAQTLRASRYSLSPKQSENLHLEHEELMPVLDKLSLLADQLASLPPQEAARRLQELDALLRTHLLPHERRDDVSVYPEVASLLGGDDPLAAMSRAHQEIFRLQRRLGALIAESGPAGMDPAALRESQRTLYALDAILRLHFAQEEEIYHGLARG